MGWFGNDGIDREEDCGFSTAIDTPFALDPEFAPDAGWEQNISVYVA
jgi:hypothetical protein